MREGEVGTWVVDVVQQWLRALSIAYLAGAIIAIGLLRLYGVKWRETAVTVAVGVGVGLGVGLALLGIVVATGVFFQLELWRWGR